MNKPAVAVVGAGPAGMCAALAASQNGWDVTLYDHNEKTGKKLFITGKGRCNLTNDRPMEDFFDQIVTNRKFLYSALYSFTNDQLRDMIEAAGTPLKVERGGRVFPCSDKSSDILKAFSRLLAERQVRVELNEHVRGLVLEDGQVKGIRLADGEVKDYDAVILATGGVSYRSTGSDGSGLQIARRAGHTITPLRAALIGVKSEQAWPGTLSGLSLKNVELSLYDGTKKKERCIYHERGELLFTHDGLSGPLVLSASSLIKGDPKDYRMSIDLKPALTPEKLDARILRDFTASPARTLGGAMEGLLPKRLIPVVIRQAGLDEKMRAGNVTKEERRKLAATLKNLTVRVRALGDINSAIITSGGVSVKEIDPGTMRSKIVRGLSFAGEMIDVDAFTGGFNVQIACSTGMLAGMSLEKPAGDEPAKTDKES